MNTLAIHPANFTRRTRDHAGKFRRERRYGPLALYHLLRLSDLGREGIERSGSFRFAIIFTQIAPPAAARSAGSSTVCCSAFPRREPCASAVPQRARK